MRFILLLAVIVLMGGTIVAPAYAATSPTLAGASGYSVLGGAAVTNTGTTTTNGAVGVSPGTSITGAGTLTAGGGTHSNDASAIAAQADRLSAFTALDAGTNADANCLNPLTGLTGIAPDGTDLTGLSLVPGLYCSAGSFLLTNGTGTDLTLTGSSGVWVFKTVSTLIVSNGASVAGGDACNVWWRIGTAATLGTTASFLGNIVTGNDADTTALQTGATLNGRVLGGTGQTVTLDSNTITGPTCSAASASSDEDEDEDEADIQVTKKANPTALLSGPGSVTYTYKVTNEGDVSLRNVSVKDDKCSPVTYVSGDTNNNERLGMDETWIYTCTKRVSATETNTATARGSASDNGDYETDTDKATVVVSVPGFPQSGVGSGNTAGASWSALFRQALSFLSRSAF